MGENSDKFIEKSPREFLADEIIEIISAGAKIFYKKFYQGPYGEKIKIKP